MSLIKYQQESRIDPEEFRKLLISSTLGERRPVDDLERIKEMVEHAAIIITARSEGKLVGVSRAISDFSYCTYLSDLAVDLSYQRQGIGKELIRLTKLAAPAATLILLSAPAAEKYYPKIGMQRHSQCFMLRDTDDLN